MQGTKPVPDKGQDSTGRTSVMVTVSPPRRHELHPSAHLPLHQGLIANGEHLTRRCQGWTDDMARQRGWAPEVA